MSLYANEKVQLWDAETDESPQTPEEVLIEAEINKRIHEGKTIQSLKRSKGWKLVDKFLDRQIADYKNKLALEQDVRTLRRMQEAIKAYSNVKAYIDWSIQEGKSFENQKTPLQEG